jgi:hypothetical protein
MRSSPFILAMTSCVLLMLPGIAAAQHACDDIGDEGWRTVPSVEVAGVEDGKPFEAGGDWLVERTTTLLPLCNYINAVGNYSLRSYQLDPVHKTERVTLCHAGAAIAPYAGSCPPQ